MAAGASGTPLARKLGVKPGDLVRVIAAPPGWSINDLPDDVRLARRRSAGTTPDRADLILAFCRSAKAVTRKTPGLATSMGDRAALWVAWPRRAGGHQSDVTDSLVRDTLLPVGVVDVKVAALDEDWSGLKFVWRKTARTPSAR